MNNLHIAEPFHSEILSLTEEEYRRKLQRRYINGQQYEFLTNMDIKERSMVELTIECFEEGDFIIDDKAYYYNKRRNYEQVMLPEDFALLFKPNANTSAFLEIYERIKKEKKLCPTKEIVINKI